MCRTRCFTSFLCMLNDLPHWSQVNTLSAVCVFLCSFRLLKLLKPERHAGSEQRVVAAAAIFPGRARPYLGRRCRTSVAFPPSG